jgi:hypothetical protein
MGEEEVTCYSMNVFRSHVVKVVEEQHLLVTEIKRASALNGIRVIP